MNNIAVRDTCSIGWIPPTSHHCCFSFRLATAQPRESQRGSITASQNSSSPKAYTASPRDLCLCIKTASLLSSLEGLQKNLNGAGGSWRPGSVLRVRAPGLCMGWGSGKQPQGLQAGWAGQGDPKKTSKGGEKGGGAIRPCDCSRGALYGGSCKMDDTEAARDEDQAASAIRYGWQQPQAGPPTSCCSPGVSHEDKVHLCWAWGSQANWAAHGCLLEDPCGVEQSMCMKSPPTAGRFYPKMERKPRASQRMWLRRTGDHQVSEFHGADHRHDQLAMTNGSYQAHQWMPCPWPWSLWSQGSGPSLPQALLPQLLFLLTPQVENLSYRFSTLFASPVSLSFKAPFGPSFTSGSHLLCLSPPFL